MKIKIKDEEIDLKLTPKGIYITENKYKEIDILGILRNGHDVEPRASDYYQVIYAAYVSVKNEIVIEYEEFLDLISDIPLAQISSIGVDLLTKRKN